MKEDDIWEGNSLAVLAAQLLRVVLNSYIRRYCAVCLPNPKLQDHGLWIEKKTQMETGG